MDDGRRAAHDALLRIDDLVWQASRLAMRVRDSGPRDLRADSWRLIHALELADCAVKDARHRAKPEA